MRLVEFASAEEQMALWKLISDNIWQSIALQVKQERQQKAKKARQSSAKRPVRTQANVPKPVPIAPTQQPKPQAVAKPVVPVKQPVNSIPSTQSNRSTKPLDAQNAVSKSVF